MTPSHAVKQGRRYRYYVSRSLITGVKADAPDGWRIPAAPLEQAVAAECAALLTDKRLIALALGEAGVPMTDLTATFAAAQHHHEQLQSAEGRAPALAAIIDRIELRPDGLRLSVTLRSCIPDCDNPDIREPLLTRDIPLSIRRRGVEMRLVLENTPAPLDPDPMLIRELRRAHRCVDALLTRRVASLGELAIREGVSDRYISSVLPLAFLAPEIAEAIVTGRQPPELTARRLIRSDIPIAWHDQKRALGFG